MSEETSSHEQRSIELEIEVPGTPEEVWRAIATGPGISSWYVPHVIEEKSGGSATASFGPGPEMQVSGRVAEWEPPHRVVFDGGAADADDADEESPAGMAFEWLVEAKEGGTCIVRLVNSGFGTGEEWDDQFDAMSGGWRIFLHNLTLHLQHFGGHSATPMLPMTTVQGTAESAWEALTGALGVTPNPAVGDRVTVTGASAPSLSGTVTEATRFRISILLEQPAPGTAFISAEAVGGDVSVSVWSYLYGTESSEISKRDEPRWFDWLAKTLHRAVRTRASTPTTQVQAIRVLVGVLLCFAAYFRSGGFGSNESE